MLTIHKFKLAMRDVAEIAMPVGAKVLSVGVQKGEVFIWAEVESKHISFDSKAVEYTLQRFRVAGTGHPLTGFGKLGRFLGTVSLQDGSLVLHVYEMQ